MIRRTKASKKSAPGIRARCHRERRKSAIQCIALGAIGSGRRQGAYAGVAAGESSEGVEALSPTIAKGAWLSSARRPSVRRARLPR
ncbi:hypothetical protein MRX96_058226 [Rhipicephalus microplus]